jgi:hypothetical protein
MTPKFISRYDPSDRTVRPIGPWQKIIEEFRFTVRPIGPWKALFFISRYDPSDTYRIYHTPVQLTWRDRV